MIPEKARLKIALFITVLLVFCPCGSGQMDLPASLIQLIANPEKYDGKHVEVIGFLRLEFEGNRIYLHEEDYTHNISENAVRIGVTKKQMKDLEDINMHYVLVLGTFKADKSQVYGHTSGAIINITVAKIWPLEKGK